MTLTYMMFFAHTNLLDRFDTSSDTKTVCYTFEVGPVNDDLLSNGALPIEKGDTLYHLTKKFSLGEVIYVSEKAPYMTMNDQGTELVPAPNKGQYTIKVEAQAVLDNGVYYVNDRVVLIGEEMAFTTPYFTGFCKCIAMEEVMIGE